MSCSTSSTVVPARRRSAARRRAGGRPRAPARATPRRAAGAGGWPSAPGRWPPPAAHRPTAEPPSGWRCARAGGKRVHPLLGPGPGPACGRPRSRGSRRRRDWGTCRRPSGTRAMPSADPLGARVSRRATGRRTAIVAAPYGDQARLIAVSSVDLPAPLAPMMATVSPSSTVRSTPKSAWNDAVAGVERHHLEQRHHAGLRIGARGRRPAPRRRHHLVAGRPRSSLRPKSMARMRSTTDSRAWTMCSIQMIETPSAVDRLDRGDQLVDLALGEPAGDLVEQEDPRPRGQGPGQLEALALEQGEAPAAALALRQQAGRARAPRPPPPAASPAGAAPPGEPKVAADQHVLEHRQPERTAGGSATSDRCRAGTGRSPRIRVTSRPSRRTVPASGLQVAGHEVQHRRLARHRSDRRRRAPHPSDSSKLRSSMTTSDPNRWRACSTSTMPPTLVATPAGRTG